MAALVILVIMIPVWAKVAIAFATFALIACWAVVSWVESYNERDDGR